MPLMHDGTYLLLQVTAFSAQTNHGLKNMVGNVWEWVSDWWQIHHTRQPLNNPVPTKIIISNVDVL